MSRVRAPSVTPSCGRLGAVLRGRTLRPLTCASSSTAEQRTLNPQVLGSKPRGRTRSTALFGVTPSTVSQMNPKYSVSPRSSVGRCESGNQGFESCGSVAPGLPDEQTRLDQPNVPDPRPATIHNRHRDERTLTGSGWSAEFRRRGGLLRGRSLGGALILLSSPGTVRAGLNGRGGRSRSAFRGSSDR
jgi:hypothetical protein